MNGAIVGNATILIVEDEFLIRMMVSDVLREAGYTVLEAGDGEEAFTILNSGQAIDLVLTDVRMPGSIDGMAVARHAKSLDMLRPVMVCSGHLQHHESQPADAFVAKPYSMTAILEIAQRLLGNSCRSEAQTRTA